MTTSKPGHVGLGLLHGEEPADEPELYENARFIRTLRSHGRRMGQTEDANSDTRNENVAQLFFPQTRMSQHFKCQDEAKGVCFCKPPCISQAPFHVPIRGGYQGGARLSKTDCSDTTQSLQVSLEGQFKKSFFGLSSSIQEVGKLFLVSPQNTSS